MKEMRLKCIQFLPKSQWEEERKAEGVKRETQEGRRKRTEVKLEMIEAR
jgi:hypothetical protein